MKLIYIDQLISNNKLEKVFGVNYFSEIRIGNSSTYKIISEDVEYQTEFEKIQIKCQFQEVEVSVNVSSV